MENSDRTQQVSQTRNQIPIQGSERAILPGATKTGPANPLEQMSVTLMLRRSVGDEELRAAVEELGSSPLSERRHFTHEEFQSKYQTDEDDVSKIEEFAREHGLAVGHVNRAAGTVSVTGRTDSFARAFGVELTAYDHPESPYRGHTGPAYVPSHLGAIIYAVLGLDNRPQSHPHFRLLKEFDHEMRSAAGTTTYTPPQVAELYNFPSNVNCSNQCIGIIELGGGYKTADLDTYFSGLGMPNPTVSDVSVDGAANKPTGSPDGPDGEVVLDIEVAAAVAQGVKVVMYFAPNTDAGFLNAITTATHDTKNKPSVISISWGQSEDSWTQQSVQAMNRAFQDAATLGVTVCVASGDNGSTDGATDGKLHVDFPASSPYVLACGGTRLDGTGQTIESETVWNDGAQGGATGGGVSDVFGLPTWQQNAKVPVSANPGGKTGRGVPDVSGNADPSTGYQVYVDGQKFPVGGTSAVAPLWAGLIAIMNEKLGRSVGYVNPLLYRLPSAGGSFHDITSGDNNINGGQGAYQAGPGWDPCTGLGSPDGTKLFTALTSVTTQNQTS